MKSKLKLIGAGIALILALFMTGCPLFGNNDDGTTFSHVGLDGMWTGTAPATGVTIIISGTGWTISGSIGPITFNDIGTFNRQGDSASLHSLFDGPVGMAHIVGEDRFRLEIEDGTFYFIRSTLAEQLAWLRINAQSGGNHTITISRDESLTPAQAGLPNINNLTITLRGDGTMRTISLAANGSLFDVNSGVTLVLDNNVTLRGRTGNDNSVVQVQPGGTLVMNTGARITGNTETGTVNTWGGGVMLWGSFTMNGGEISNNSANWGGGVQVQGTFNMHGGTISNNTARSGGGGVHTWGSDTVQGAFTMHNGTISGNTVTGGNYIDGGGVRVSDGGIFTMHNGRIFNNAVNSNTGANGGGVSVRGTFTMLNGEISGNTAIGATWGQGGGVSINCYCGGLFVMRGGKISGNTAVSNSENWANGGGVLVSGYSPTGGIFRMSGGVIYDDNIIRYVGNMDGSSRTLSIGTAGANSATAEFGTFIGASFSRAGNFTTTNNTVRVENGVWANW